MLVGSGNWTVCNIYYVHCNRTVALEGVPFFTLGSKNTAAISFIRKVHLHCTGIPCYGIDKCTTFRYR